MATIIKRTITSQEMRRQQEGATQIAPGLWTDAAGDLHLSIPDVLAVMGLADTLDNREAVVRHIEHLLNTESHRPRRVIRQDVQDA